MTFMVNYEARLNPYNTRNNTTLRQNTLLHHTEHSTDTERCQNTWCSLKKHTRGTHQEIKPSLNTIPNSSIWWNPFTADKHLKPEAGAVRSVTSWLSTGRCCALEVHPELDRCFPSSSWHTEVWCTWNPCVLLICWICLFILLSTDHHEHMSWYDSETDGIPSCCATARRCRNQRRRDALSSGASLLQSPPLTL